MTSTLPRPLVILGTALALSLPGGTVAGAQQAPSTSSSTTTSPPVQSTTTAAPTSTRVPAPLDGKPGENGAGAPGAATPTPTTAAAPATTAGTATTVTTTTQPKPGDPPGSSTTTATSNAAPPTQPPSLTPSQVDQVLRDQQRSGANSTKALVDALRPLQNLGMTMDEALALGMGRFPVQGVANWTDDWLDPRSGPPPHQHQGNDLFAAFDVPVRAPADGIVTFEDAGLGGKGAYVTTSDGTYYYMAHLNSFKKDLASGARVTQGQVVGYNGDSGNAKGGAPHVHFEIHPRGGAAVNPKPILDGWVAEAVAKVPELIASFQPKPADGTAIGTAADDGGTLPQILLNTGLTRRFTAPSLPVPRRERPDPGADQGVVDAPLPPVVPPVADRD